MNELKIFENNEFGQIRATSINNQPWFVLTDVCRILNINNPSQLKTRLNQDGVITNEVIDSLGRKQDATFINESNLYKTIFQSRKEEAERFSDWVTSEVLPSIRKTGQYSTIDTSQLSPELQMFKQIFDSVATQQLKLNQVETQVESIKTNLLTQHDDNWREWVNRVLKTVGHAVRDFKKPRIDSYAELEKRAGCNLKVRLDNLKARALNNDKSISYIKNLNYLDILEDEKRLKEIYLTIIKEYAIKYGVN